LTSFEIDDVNIEDPQIATLKLYRYMWDLNSTEIELIETRPCRDEDFDFHPEIVNS
jgi:hypothetical protein